MGQDEYIQVDVVYAGEHTQSVIPLRVLKGSTVADIIQQSGIHAQGATGIWGKRVDLATPVTQEGARVEIYRPLLIDPKQARLKRAT
jgi:putative ubiquitin-RnfH superfamily antitoxin RatB of RatAB toxin-antitoxin module